MTDQPLVKGRFAESAIFPGTRRTYWVYVTRRLESGTRPAPIMVFQDGVLFDAPSVFDRLIDDGAIPPLIGIFVASGHVKAVSPDAAPRINRSHEYDELDDGYTRFLLEELLPHVAREHRLELSEDPNDRAIAGVSSGGICAFTAAWQRPDAFRRVFSGVGSFTDLRGGRAYPTLVRKTEPKPIRVFLQDGHDDLLNSAGDWWMANQEMERALRFAGYDVEHSWGEGGHGLEHATQVFPDAVRWLWRDYPAPIVANPRGESKQLVMEVLIDGEGWQHAGRGSGGTTAVGQTRSPDRSLVYVADPVRPFVYSFQVQSDGSLAHGQRFFHLHRDDGVEATGPRAMTVDRQGWLYVTTEIGIQICDPLGRTIGIVPAPGREPPSDVALRGPNLDELHVTCGAEKYRRRVRVRGLAPGSGPVNPPLRAV